MMRIFKKVIPILILALTLITLAPQVNYAAKDIPRSLSITFNQSK